MFRIFYPKSSYSQRIAQSDQPGLKSQVSANPLARKGMAPLLQLNIDLAIPHVELKPNLEECQSVINDAIRFVVFVPGQIITHFADFSRCWLGFLIDRPQKMCCKFSAITLQNKLLNQGIQKSKKMLPIR